MGDRGSLASFYDSFKCFVCVTGHLPLGIALSAVATFKSL